MKKKELLEKLREAVAGYMSSEGCTCCQNIKEHEKYAEILAELLDVPKYSDGSGYNFDQFRSQK